MRPCVDREYVLSCVVGWTQGQIKAVTWIIGNQESVLGILS